MAMPQAAPLSPTGLLALVVLVAQMSGLTLAMRASRTQSELYNVGVAVLLTELLKLGVCASFAFLRRWQTHGLQGALDARAAAEGLAWVFSTAGPIALPAVLFVLTQQVRRRPRARRLPQARLRAWHARPRCRWSRRSCPAAPQPSRKRERRGGAPRVPRPLTARAAPTPRFPRPPSHAPPS